MNKQRMPVSAVETPAVIIYLDVLESNIAEMSRLAGEAALKEIGKLVELEVARLVGQKRVLVKMIEE